MKRKLKKVLSFALALVMIVTLCPTGQFINVTANDSEPYCISVGRPAYASSGDNEDFAVDGDMSTRWQADSDDEKEWFYVDLGKVANIDNIYIKWEAAYAKSYEIQFSNDETNWRTVYTKGKGASEDETVSQIMTVSRNSLSTNGEKIVTTLSWSELDGVSYYYIYLDDIADNMPATAADGYPFSGNWGTRTSCEVWVRNGEHTYTVVGYDVNGGEMARASMVINSEDVEIETTTVESDTIDPTEHTITLDNLGTSEKQARYVKIIMTERQLENYGCSFFEFQVYGDNGLVERPADYGTNLALNQPVTSSGIRDEWWMYDEEGNLTESAVNNVKEENAVDGDYNTSYTSYQGDNQWLYVDLGQEYNIGRVCIDWNADGGKIYDVDVSSDGENWTTIHRVLRGYAEMKDNFTCYYENVRYVRVFGYTKVESGSGFGINELEVYEYIDGDSRENETIENLPVREIVYSENGKASYVTGEMYNEKNKLPTFVNEENITVPIDSNSWWSSALVKTFSNLLCVTPLKSKFSTKGLGVLTATAGWVGTRGENDLGTDQSTETGIDFYVNPDGYNASKGYDRVENYGDYSLQLGLMDNKGIQMKTTFVKGSPYLFNEFCDNTIAFINSSTITEVFDGNGNPILDVAGETITTDHIGFTSVDEENTKANNEGTYYCITVPEGTQFKSTVVGSKYTIKVIFPSAKENYMSIATMNGKDQIDTFYQHGYAFVTDTYVGYTFDEATSKVVTTYDITTKVMREGFSDVTMQAMFPHQWKKTTDAQNAYTTYKSIRGDMKAIWANSYKTTQQFAGLLPTFALPESDMLDTESMIEYLNTVVASKINTAPVDDAYWEGKNVHPLAISAVMADQLGEIGIRDKLLKKLKSIMVDWFNYDGDGDTCYLIYNKDWGTVYYPNSAYGANAAICDHNFTYGYFAYGAAILAMYDKEFLADYGDMVEILIRDYANPLESEEDGMFCKFRSFDQYSGHSWAGGYADSDSGNNQESASEALFAWVGMYLWGQVTQNQTYIDAAAYGFTTEMEAVLQYWFDYDETNWLEEFPFEGIGQIYGASMGYGTYFGGQPVYVYGIQWLPISEYLTNYGMNQEKCAKVYAGLEYDTQYAIDIEMRLGNITSADEYVTPDNGWQHITWPFLSQSDPQRAYEKFSANVTSVQAEDRANTLWFIAAMDQLGYRTTDYVVTGNIQGSVYYNNETDKYTAEVWNPTNVTQTVRVVDSADASFVGTANIGAGALVSFNIDTEGDFELTQVATPTMKATGLSDGVVTEKLSSEAKFSDTQIVEIECEQEDATIYYTTDGTTPTTDSNVYNGRILVSSNTIVKSIAIKDGYINSAYAATSFIIEGDTVQDNEDLAYLKTATSSSSSGNNTADKAVDGDTSTRWESDSTDDEYFQVDLGAIYAVNTVIINWEAAYASEYTIEVSKDGKDWTTVASQYGLAGIVETTFSAVDARYVRMSGVSRATAYGYSFYDFEVYGALQADAPTITPTSGEYETGFEVSMSTSVKGAEIKYTIDGSTPTEESATYIEPVTIDKSAVVKAATYRKGMEMSEIIEAKYVVNGTVAIDNASINVTLGKTKVLEAITNEVVEWKSKDLSIASVDENGVVTGNTVGITEVVATLSNGAYATCTVVVVEPINIESIILSDSILDMKVHTTYPMHVVITPDNTTDDTTIIWTSSDRNIVEVDKDGNLTAKAVGNVVVTATVSGVSAECIVTVNPIPYEEMIASDKFNLALNKTVILSTIYKNEGSQNENILVNGDLTDQYISTDWDKTRTSEYIWIDLGANYTAEGIDEILLQFKNDSGTFCNDYEVQFSSNDIEYITVATENNVTFEETDDGLYVISTEGAEAYLDNVRYVKIILDGNKNWGYQMREVAVLSTDQNAEEVEITKCDNPSLVKLTSDELCKLTYTIIPDEGQEDYTYDVYLNGSKIVEKTSELTDTINGLEAGTYIITVVSNVNGAYSEGISAEIYVDDGKRARYIDTIRNLAKDKNASVDTIYAKEGSQDPATLIDGNVKGQYVSTDWGVQTATVLIDLENTYRKEDIEKVIFAFKSENTFANNYSVEFSEDGNIYEAVYVTENEAYSEIIENSVDVSQYLQDNVRYVKISFNDGDVYNWGYQLYEIAIIGTADCKPVESTDDFKITGYQMTTTLNQINDNIGFRVMYQVEETVEGKVPLETGLVYGIVYGDNSITKADLVCDSNSRYVASFASTAEGKISAVYGDSETASYYVMTMNMAANTKEAYTTYYIVRAYAKMADGSIVYSDATTFTMYSIADCLYQNNLVSTQDSFDCLYNNILSVVDANYEKKEFNWSGTVVK